MVGPGWVRVERVSKLRVMGLPAVSTSDGARSGPGPPSDENLGFWVLGFRTHPAHVTYMWSFQSSACSRDSGHAQPRVTRGSRDRSGGRWPQASPASSPQKEAQTLTRAPASGLDLGPISCNNVGVSSTRLL